ncbi:MAG: phosphate transport system ATP-binding protein, partial [Gammaproteobacteria bacterium]
MGKTKTMAIETKGLSLWYGDFQALFEVDLSVREGEITAMIGPSGCGKSTFLRTINRINERHSYVRTSGSVEVFGEDVMDEDVELVQVRKQIGMVFQRPNALPISIRENVLFGLKLHSTKRLSRGQQDEEVEKALRRVLLWDNVKDRLHDVATSLSLEEQQKLCIARLLPMKPRVLLMDEPCS